MSAETYRKYIDIIDDNNKKSVRLNEGISDGIKNRTKNLISKFLSLGNDAKQAYASAKTHKDELLHILKTSKDAEKAKEKIVYLAKSNLHDLRLTEEFSNHPVKTRLGLLMTLLSAGYLLYNNLVNKMQLILMIPTDNPNMMHSILAVERIPHVILEYAVPLLFLLYGLELLYLAATEDE